MPIMCSSIPNMFPKENPDIIAYIYVHLQYKNYILLLCLPNSECRPSAIDSPVALFFRRTIVPE